MEMTLVTVHLIRKTEVFNAEFQTDNKEIKNFNPMAYP